MRFVARGSVAAVDAAHTSFSRRGLRVLAFIALLAFGLRILVRLLRGPADFWTHGYTFYFELACHLAAGEGYSLGDGPTAFRVPLYPLFLAAITGGVQRFIPIVLAQALVGTVTVVCGAWIARRLAGEGAALVTAGMLALYPYYVVHDTALQETSLFTALTALAVIALLHARSSPRLMPAALAGAALAAATLTRSALLPWAALAPFWLGASAPAPARTRVSRALLCAGMLAFCLAPWLAYSKKVLGAPALGTETGYMLWRGHNPQTFSRYPNESMDASAAVAYAALPAEAQAELAALGKDEIAINRWFLQRARTHVAEDPVRALAASVRKVGAAFGVLPSPRREWLANAAHALSYGPLLVLALFGMVLARADRSNADERMLLHALIVWMVGVTAVFFGHTSHRSAIDVYLAVFAAVSIVRARARLA